MERVEYKNIVNKYTKKETRLKNALIAFITGGLMGMLGNFLVDQYVYLFDISKTTAATIMIITLVFFGCRIC